MYTSSSSPSLLAREPVRGEDDSASTRPQRRSVRPFLLRSTTPLARSPTPPGPPSLQSPSSRLEQGPTIARSKTETALSTTRTTTKLEHDRPSTATTATPTRRSAAPRTQTSTSVDPSSSRAPVRPSRTIVFVPDSPDETTSSSSSSSRLGRRAPTQPRPRQPLEPLLSSSSSREKQEAVERRKLKLKRDSLLSRKHPRVVVDDHENVAPSSPLSQQQQPLARNKTWSLRPLRRDPPASARPRPPLLLDDAVEAAPPVRGPDATRATRQARRDEDDDDEPHRNLANAVCDDDDDDADRVDEDSRASHLASTSGFGMERTKSGYTSLHELLAEQGYRETRVATPPRPTLTLNASNETNPFASTTTTTRGGGAGLGERRGTAAGFDDPLSLAPPRGSARAVKDKGSILSLRGLFSFFGAGGGGGESLVASRQDQDEEVAAAAAGEDPVPTAVTAAAAEANLDQGKEGGGGEPPSPTRTDGTFTHSPISRAREWVRGVAIATARDDLEFDRERCHPDDDNDGFNSSLPRVEISLPRRSTTEQSKARRDHVDRTNTCSLPPPPSSCGGRSYSSSIVTSSSIRSAPVRHHHHHLEPLVGLDQGTRTGTTAAGERTIRADLNSNDDDEHSMLLSASRDLRLPLQQRGRRGSTTTAAKAIKSLRHVVSDSTLASYLPQYTSFPFSPNDDDDDGRLVGSYCDDDDDDDEPRPRPTTTTTRTVGIPWWWSPLSSSPSMMMTTSSRSPPPRPSRMLSPSSARSGPIDDASSRLEEADDEMRPCSRREKNELRHEPSRAVFSIANVGLGLSSTSTCTTTIQTRATTTTTTRNMFPLLQRQQLTRREVRDRRQQREEEEEGREDDDKKPKLLRKAVSSAGLVRPVLTTTLT